MRLELVFIHAKTLKIIDNYEKMKINVYILNTCQVLIGYGEICCSLWLTLRFS